MQISFPLAPVVLLATLLFFLLSSGAGIADELVSCRHQQAEGETISLQLDIGSPPPSMLILVQRLPKGITVDKAVPPIKKFNPHKGEAKWLLKRPQPGTTLFTINLNGTVTADQISGEIRYKDPNGGKMKVMKIKP